MGALTLRTTIEPFGPACALILTDEQVAELGGGKRAPVVVGIGERSVRLRLAVMGGVNCIGISKANRAALGIEIGDAVEAVVALDVAPREVDLPAALADALADDHAARSAYEKLAFTHQREFAEWVSSAKRPETRERRVAQALDMLREGRTRS